MPIQLPDFSESGIEWLSVCICFPASDNVAKSVVPDKEQRQLAAEYGQGSARHFIQLLLSTFPDGMAHVHANIVGGDYFDDGNPPRNLVPIESLTEVLEKLIGHTIAFVIVKGRQLFEREEVEFSSTTSLVGLTTEAGDETMELTGATFAISGRPYDELEWELIDDQIDGKVVASFSNAEFTNNYLLISHDTVVRGLKKILLGSRMSRMPLSPDARQSPCWEAPTHQFDGWDVCKSSQTSSPRKPARADGINRAAFAELARTKLALSNAQSELRQLRSDGSRLAIDILREIIGQTTRLFGERVSVYESRDPEFPEDTNIVFKVETALEGSQAIRAELEWAKAVNKIAPRAGVINLLFYRS